MAALLTLLLVAAVIAVVASPMLRRRSTATPAAESVDRAELQSAREAKYREIRDAELDYRTGKLSREDYDAVDSSLRAEALSILDGLEALEDEKGRLDFLEQQDRVQHEHDCEADSPTV